jgi:hypothetical protein
MVNVIRDHVSRLRQRGLEMIGKMSVIDALHASTCTLQRAHHTAIEIAEHNHDAKLKATTDEIYVEINSWQAHIPDLATHRN